MADTEKGWHDLANAIVLKAVDDYRAARRNPDNPESLGRIREIRKFFRSTWFGMLTTIDPEYLIDKLDKEARDDNKGTIPVVSPKQGDRTRSETA